MILIINIFNFLINRYLCIRSGKATLSLEIKRLLAVYISRKIVQNILHLNKFHSYNIQKHQELAEDDFSQSFVVRVLWNSFRQNWKNNFLDSVVFSDEATFFWNCTVNLHNCRYWSDSNSALDGWDLYTISTKS